jgi:transcriptional regulator with XRE-family HTH domain
MIYLTNLRNTRLALDIKRGHIARITGIDEPRIRALELREAEPWFDEACKLARTLCCMRICDLLGDDWREDSLITSPMPNDLEVWRSGYRAPLSLALRISALFGLDDPYHLDVTPLMQQLWSVVEASERHPEAPGWCPWCAADIIGGDPHLPTCLGHNLLIPHLQRTGLGDLDLPRPYQKGQARMSAVAYGLKALRLGKELTQVQLAEQLGMGQNYYSQLERGVLPLTLKKANIIAAFYGVDRAVLYAAPEDA